MLFHIRRLFSQSLIYGVGDAATRVASILLLPVYTRILTPEDYGKLAIVTMISTVVGLIIDSGQRSAFFRFYFQSENPQARSKLTGTVFIYLLVFSGMILLPLVIFIDQGVLPRFINIALIPLIQIALIGTFFDVSSTIPFAIFRAEQRAKNYASLSVLRFMISVILNILVIVVLRWGVVGVIYANLLTSIIFFVICTWMTLPIISWSLDLKLLNKLLRFGLPLVPANLAGWILTLSDRFFLEKYTDIGQVGIYAVGYSIASIVNMIMSWFNTAVVPYYFSISQKSDAKIIYARTLTYAITFFTMIGLLISIFSSEAVFLLASPSYFNSASIVPIIVLAYLFFELNYLFSFGLDITGKTGYYPFIMGTAAILNLLLNFVLIPNFGMMGAAIATVLSYAVLPIIEFFVVRKFYPVSYEWKRLIKLAIVSVGVYVLSLLLKTGQLGIDLLTGSSFFVVWAFVLYKWDFLTESEIISVRLLSRKYFFVLNELYKKIFQ
jgi:O-antigen/teichoic acid export membrane protein